MVNFELIVLRITSASPGGPLFPYLLSIPSYPFRFPPDPLLSSIKKPSHLYLCLQYDGALVSSLVLQITLGNGYRSPLGESSAIF